MKGHRRTRSEAESTAVAAFVVIEFGCWDAFTFFVDVLAASLSVDPAAVTAADNPHRFLRTLDRDSIYLLALSCYSTREEYEVYRGTSTLSL